MLRFNPIYSLLILLLMGSLAAPGASSPQDLPEHFMPSSEVRAGMVGEGRTVYEGYETTTFKAHILGVERNPMAGGNIILARLEAPFLEQHGVVAGMSGSPVFIDGRLIGAVAYGWSFAYKPYCGITPIENMWTMWEHIGTENQAVTRRADAASQSRQRIWDWQAAFETYEARLHGRAQSDPLQAQAFKPRHPALSGEEGSLVPLWGPLFFSGASTRSAERLRNFLGDRGLEVYATGGLGGSASEPIDAQSIPPMTHGSSLAVALMTGDLSLFGIGTATWREGNKIIGFGHPMFFEGQTNAPMAQARVFGFMQSYSRSFKLSSAGPIVGTIDQDRLYGIGGFFGQAPAMAPSTVSIQGDAAYRPREYHFETWKKADWLPVLALTALEESFTASVAPSGELTAATRYEIRLADGRTIEKRYKASSDVFVIVSAARGLLRDLFLLLDNPFQEADIDSIAIEVDVEPGLREDAILDVASDRTRYLPGETVRLEALFRPWRGEDYKRRWQVPLSPDLTPGVYVIHVADADGALRIRQQHRPELFRPQSFDDIMTLVGNLEAEQDRLHLFLFEPSMELGLDNRSLQGLPSTLQSIVSQTAPTHLQHIEIGRQLDHRVETMPVPVYGNFSLAIEVVDKLNP